VSFLSVKGVSFSYPGNREPTVNAVSFNAEPGEHIALVGPNGSGKTTLFRLLIGAFGPESGRVLLGGKEVRAYPVHERARRIASVSQGVRISFPYTCLELVLMGLHPYRPLTALPGNADLSQAEEIMRETGVWRFAGKSALTLSGGELQRVLLARALLQIFPDSCFGGVRDIPEGVPKLLLLDEAFSELDIAVRIHMMKLLNRLLEKHRFTVIGIHHDIHLAYRFSNRVIALRRGGITGDGKPAEVFTRAFFERVFGVEAEIVPGKGFFFNDEIGGGALWAARPPFT
jgi:iron complex transport system ATP-binding protein